MEHTHVAIIGAGPYGLAVTAFLRERGIAVRTFGRSMEFWQHMPSGMFLKSAWSASSIADPRGDCDLDHFAQATAVVRTETVPMSRFVEYGHWFQRRCAPDVEPVMVTHLTRAERGFQLECDNGQLLSADRAVIATGLAACAYLPEPLRQLPPALMSHTQDHRSFAPFAGRQVAVLGRGQSAIETAALLSEAGADVELIARGPLQWITRTLYHRTGPARRLFYPPSDVGPPGLNWLIHFPGLMHRIPSSLRTRIAHRAVRPAGANWLYSRIEGHVRITTDVAVVRAQAEAGHLVLTLSDGTVRRVEHAIAGTGYQPTVACLGFMSESLRAQVAGQAGYPTLNGSFESSVPGLYFVGAFASHSFGPLCRFVSGSHATARRVAWHVAMRHRATDSWLLSPEVDMAREQV